MRAERATAHSSKLVLRDWSSQFLSLRCRPGRCGSPCERVLAADGPAVLDRASHADKTRVDGGDPAIAVLSIGYRPLCSRPRGAAGAERLRALYRFLDAGDTEGFRMRSRPASKKRRGTKSREVGHRRSSECYGVLDLGMSKSGGPETRGRVKPCGTIVAK